MKKIKYKYYGEQYIKEVSGMMWVVEIKSPIINLQKLKIITKHTNI